MTSGLLSKWIAACLIAPALACAAETADGAKWELAYSYDANDSALTITDLKFWSARRGIACGFIEKRVSNPIFGERSKEIPIVLLTGDGGKSWEQVTVKDRPLSLFVLGESLGWLVSSEGLWMTGDAGRGWKRVSLTRNLLAVYFLSAKHGFAGGSDDQALETVDGGANWTPIVLEGGLPGPPKIGAELNVVLFANGTEGMISGNLSSPSGHRHLRSLFTTSNGGRSWHHQTLETPGPVSAATFSADGGGLAVRQTPNASPAPSEVFTLRSDGVIDAEPIYRERNRVITDAHIAGNGTTFLAGFDLPGESQRNPLPGKVRIVRRDSLSQATSVESSYSHSFWKEVRVDYRAVAKRVVLAAAGDSDMFAATDTGMILKLSR